MAKIDPKKIRDLINKAKQKAKEQQERLRQKPNTTPHIPRVNPDYKPRDTYA